MDDGEHGEGGKKALGCGEVAVSANIKTVISKQWS
jgi:hypothetical protein